MRISVTDETLERATRVKRLIGCPRKLCSARKRSDSNQSPQSERKSNHTLW
ncbi:hypothetical protein [Lysinibacillus sp. G4S2]|uniref:hypothetical protein n=1 Tax=Lysinibacillus sp. G4S2 TaxID=3055859 RepID=UPI0025A1A546|nr:hypothetical protein [Lysinibacillus sp. G4S2]MDM5247017.1 hypothetical protein [Lysinibacillus sp. G4S2]